MSEPSDRELPDELALQCPAQWHSLPRALRATSAPNKASARTQGQKQEAEGGRPSHGCCFSRRFPPRRLLSAPRAFS